MILLVRLTKTLIELLQVERIMLEEGITSTMALRLRLLRRVHSL